MGEVSYIGEGNGGRFSKLPMWDKVKRDIRTLIFNKGQTGPPEKSGSLQKQGGGRSGDILIKRAYLVGENTMV